MGKGDVKSKKGKIWRGSYGKKRPARAKKIELPKKIASLWVCAFTDHKDNPCSIILQQFYEGMQ